MYIVHSFKMYCHMTLYIVYEKMYLLIYLDENFSAKLLLEILRQTLQATILQSQRYSSVDRLNVDVMVFNIT